MKIPKHYLHGRAQGAGGAGEERAALNTGLQVTHSVHGELDE